jgi:TRAP-type mannitol/chloroaromatic compound transport system substrate-binding protein
VPPAQAFDAVSSGALDAAWATPGFWTGKDIAFAVYSTVPFGPGMGEYIAWMKEGGGEKMMQALYAKYNIHSVVCHLIPPEASGWFRKEITTLADLKGLKMRFFGLGANVMQNLGVSTQLLQAGEIFQALQLGTIDATEFSMPVMDLSLGFHQVAKFYYFPGWHQQASVGQLYISKSKWAELSDTQKLIIEQACRANMLQELADSEADQAEALEQMQKQGVQFRQFPPAVLAAFEAKWREVVEEESTRSANFRRVWDSYAKFRAGFGIWRDRGYVK